MTETEALQLIGEMCVRTMGIAIVAAYHVCGDADMPTLEYLNAQRMWYDRMQDRLNVENQVDEALRGTSAGFC